jgi:hypothetical protein
VGEIAGVRAVYLNTIALLRARAISTHDVSQRVRLSKSPSEYLAARERRRELSYEALLAAGRTRWDAGDRVRVYRKQNGEGGLVEDADEDPRDYDVDYYVRLLRASYAQRLARAFTPADFEAVFADPDQLSIFSPSMESIRSILTPLRDGTA